MARFDNSAAKLCAKRLVGNASLVALWTNFSDELREMMIDSAVMEHVRLSDEESKIEIGQLVAFRQQVVDALANGVFIGKSRHGLTFHRDREKRREQAAYERGWGDHARASANLLTK